MKAEKKVFEEKQKMDQLFNNQAYLLLFLLQKNQIGNPNQ